MGSLIQQFAMQNEESFSDFERFYDIHHPSESITKPTTVEELFDLLKTMASHFATSMIILDGLDEISTARADVVELLGNLSSDVGRIKTLFASREESDIGHCLQHFEKLSIAARSSDLRLYVASEIETRIRKRQLRIHDPNLKEEIMKRLIDKADGM